MPQLVFMNCRRLRPTRLLLTSASSSIRRSTRFCVSLCGGGRYSPLDTICVGMGVAAEIASAPATRRCSRSLSQLVIGVLLYPRWLLRVRGERPRRCRAREKVMNSRRLMLDIELPPTLAPKSSGFVLAAAAEPPLADGITRLLAL